MFECAVLTDEKEKEVNNDLDFDVSGDSLQKPVSKKQRRKSKKNDTRFKTQQIEDEEEFRYPDIATSSVQGNAAGIINLRQTKERSNNRIVSIMDDKGITDLGNQR